MKVGDLVKSTVYCPERIGVFLEFVPCTHSKEWPRIKVLADYGVTNWLLQYCEVISECR